MNRKGCHDPVMQAVQHRTCFCSLMFLFIEKIKKAQNLAWCRISTVFPRLDSWREEDGKALGWELKD